MSSLLFIAQSNKDPYLACLNGVSTHPHYHDCENCEHVANKTCEYGVGKKTSKELKAAIDEGKNMLAAYPKLDPSRLP